MTAMPKGQIISKWFFGVFDFLQKTNENKSTWGIIVVKSNSFVRFLEEIEDTKNHFEINWPLRFEFSALVYFSGPEGSTKVHKKQNLLL